MAARGMGAIVPATGATGMTPVAAVGGKANSPIGKVCVHWCQLACSFGVGHHVSSCIDSFSPCNEVYRHAVHELPLHREWSGSDWMRLRIDTSLVPALPDARAWRR